MHGTIKKYIISIVVFLIFLLSTYAINVTGINTGNKDSAEFALAVTLNTIVNLFGISIGVLIAAWILWGRTPWRKPEAMTPASSDLLQSAMKKVLESTEFVSIFTNALPKGRGLAEHFPVMLSSIASRRARAQKSANVFLLMTIGLGLLFSSTVLYFGYIIVNEQSTGLGRIIAEIERHESDLFAEDKNREGRALDYFDEVLDAVAKVLALSSDKSMSEIERLKIAIPAHLQGGYQVRANWADPSDVENFVLQLQETNRRWAKAIKKLPAPDRNAFTNLRATTDKYSSSIQRRSALLQTNLAEIRALVERGRELEDDDSNRILDLIKRLSVGIIVSSFLLTLLRYVAGLYREERQNLREADHAEDIVRRFCVAVESADDGKSRQDLAERFLLHARESGPRQLQDATMDNSATATVQTLVAELLTMVKKGGSPTPNPPSKLE